MSKNKENNFISAVVYLQGVEETALKFFETLNLVLDEHFAQYEIIAVDPDNTSHSNRALREWAKKIDHPLTIINMSLRQSHEQCMNAGLNIAIGDYVYEFDSTDMPYDAEIVWEAYQTAMEGNDIVNICPKQEKGMSRLFYTVFNSHCNAAYKLRTDAFRIVSRRAINRACAMNENLPYRKATYASCGLKVAVIEFDGSVKNRNARRFELAVDSLVLYTNFGYKLSLSLTFLMLLGALAELIYTLVVWFAGDPISGWTTTMFVLTLGLTGLFTILAVVLKYLTLILKINFQKQNYLIENIEKL